MTTFFKSVLHFDACKLDSVYCAKKTISQVVKIQFL